MKKILALVAALTSFSAFATQPHQPHQPLSLTPTSTLAQQQQQQTSTAQSDASNAGNVQVINFGASDNSVPQTINQNVTQGGDTTQRIVYSGTQTVKNVPSVSGPPLVSSNDTCMGSASGAVNGPGFGVALGKTYTDTNCVMLKNSREFWNMGMKAASLALMCNDSLNREALEMTGFECPQTARDKAKGAPIADASVRGEYTDPIVRARLGLPPLK